MYPKMSETYKKYDKFSYTYKKGPISRSSLRGIYTQPIYSFEFDYVT